MIYLAIDVYSSKPWYQAAQIIPYLHKVVRFGSLSVFYRGAADAYFEAGVRLATLTLNSPIWVKKSIGQNARVCHFDSVGFLPDQIALWRAYLYILASVPSGLMVHQGVNGNNKEENVDHLDLRDELVSFSRSLGCLAGLLSTLDEVPVSGSELAALVTLVQRELDSLDRALASKDRPN